MTAEQPPPAAPAHPAPPVANNATNVGQIRSPEPFHLLCADRALREQLRLVLTALKTPGLVVHEPNQTAWDVVLQTAKILMVGPGLVLVGPPTAYLGAGKANKSPVDFLAAVSAVIKSAGKDSFTLLARLVPVFPDIEFREKRERLLQSVAKLGSPTAFILKKLDSVSTSAAPAYKKLVMEEHLKSRFGEIKAYLDEFLPNRGKLADLVAEQASERDLAERKRQAEEWMRKAAQAKSAKDWELAVVCCKKAIECRPEDPSAYLESGRVYVRLKKYPRAVHYFTQAEELARAIPTPNAEIGTVRVLQVAERLEAGDSPNSPEVLELLAEAVENFSQSLKKAVRMATLAPEDDPDRTAVFSRTAADVIRIDLAGLVGKKHAAVKALRAAVQEAYASLPGVDPENHDARGLLVLGLAAADEERYNVASDMLFRAAKDPQVFEEACRELTYFGAVLRRAKGPEAAVVHYGNLLALGPPNRAAVKYNLAVALITSGRELDAVQTLVEALVEDPSLPENDMFYKNPQLHPLLLGLGGVLTGLARSPAAQPSEGTIRVIGLEAKLTTLLADGLEKEAFSFLVRIVQAAPAFFKSESMTADKAVYAFIERKRDDCLKSSMPELAALGRALAGLCDARKLAKPSRRLIAYKKCRFEALKASRVGADHTVAAGLAAKAVHCYPEYVQTPEFAADPFMSDSVRRLVGLFAAVDPKRVSLTEPARQA